MAVSGISPQSPMFGCARAQAPRVRFGEDGEGPQKPQQTPNISEQAQGLLDQVKEFVDLFSEAIRTTRQGITDAAKVIRALPQWDATLKTADPEKTALDRLKSVLDVALAEFRRGYTGAGEEGDDMANFALYNGVLKRFPGLAAMQDNELAQTVLDGALASNPFRPADEAREALDELLTSPAAEGGEEETEETPLTAEQIDEALGVPADVTKASRSFETDA